MRIAITTDWLVTMGGAERVIAQMLEVWPQASVFTTVHNEKRKTLADRSLQKSEGWKNEKPSRPHTTYLQKWYSFIKTHRPLIFQMPRAVESWDLRGFDVILSSSHAVAKGCIPPSSAVHICYCHTPMRYAWEMEDQYLKDFHIPAPLRSFVKRKMEKLRQWDLTTSKRVDFFLANSRTTQERIKRIYGRDSVVLHPPVGDEFFCSPLKRNKTQDTRHTKEDIDVRESCFLSPVSCKGSDYFLTVGRLVPYKRFDIPIEAANRAGFNLKVVGTGPDEKRLKKIAGPTVEMLGHVSEEELFDLYRNARAFIFPTFEDAGIVPLESQACGTPVIAYGRGGALDTVIDGKTGIFFRDQNIDSLVDALKRFEGMNFDSGIIREHARQFSSSNFREKLECIVTEYCGQSTRV